MMEELKLGFQVLQFLMTCGIGFYVHLTNKDKVTNDRITLLQDDIDTKSDDHGERIAKLEAHAEKAPTHNDMAKIHEKINQVSACVSRMEGEFSGATRTLQLIHETLMEERRK